MYSWDLKQVDKISLITSSRSPVYRKLTGCIRGTLNRWTKEPHYLFKVTSWLETYRMYSWNLKQVGKMSLSTCSKSPVDWKLIGCIRETLKRGTKWASLLVQCHQLTRNLQDAHWDLTEEDKLSLNTCSKSTAGLKLKGRIRLDLSSITVCGPSV